MRYLDILIGNENSCNTSYSNFYQQLVLVNKKDVKDYLITKDLIFNNEIPKVNYNIQFSLKDLKKGVRIVMNENSDNINASFSKSVSNGLSRYNHKVTFALQDTSEYYKYLLYQLDNSKDYFIALQRKNNQIEIYGFNNGFKVDSYDFDNGTIIELTSSFLEYDLPYIYKSKIQNNEVDDFDYSFNKILNKDYNTNFNNDF